MSLTWVGTVRILVHLGAILGGSDGSDRESGERCNKLSENKIHDREERP